MFKKASSPFENISPLDQWKAIHWKKEDEDGFTGVISIQYVDTDQTSKTIYMAKHFKSEIINTTDSVGRVVFHNSKGIDRATEWVSKTRPRIKDGVFSFDLGPYEMVTLHIDRLDKILVKVEAGNKEEEYLSLNE